jgi:hypothetical protein
MTAPIHELPQHTAESLKNLPKPKPLDNFNPKASVKLPSVVLLDIQALFDTRLAALTLFAKEEALELCVSGRYFRREKDSFELKAGLFSAEALRRIRQAGRRDLLTNSQMTAIPSFLRQITKEPCFEFKAVFFSPKVTPTHTQLKRLFFGKKR